MAGWVWLSRERHRQAGEEYFVEYRYSSECAKSPRDRAFGAGEPPPSGRPHAPPQRNEAIVRPKNATSPLWDRKATLRSACARQPTGSLTCRLPTEYLGFPRRNPFVRQKRAGEAKRGVQVVKVPRETAAARSRQGAA